PGCDCAGPPPLDEDLVPLPEAFSATGVALWANKAPEISSIRTMERIMDALLNVRRTPGTFFWCPAVSLAESPVAELLFPSANLSGRLELELADQQQEAELARNLQPLQRRRTIYRGLMKSCRREKRRQSNINVP